MENGSRYVLRVFRKVIRVKTIKERLYKITRVLVNKQVKYFRFAVPVEVTEALDITENDRFRVMYDEELGQIVYQRV